MSIFKVEVVKINQIIAHPNADRLDIASFEGMEYQVITVKGNFKIGDLAYYFPIDSVIPDKYLDEFGIRNYYSKKLRAAKLRGIFSEGLLIPLTENIKYRVGDDCTEYFGVTKYEYPIPRGMRGDMESQIGHYKFPSCRY
jgi:RNA ligase (TIGR02306 family)